MRSRHSYVGYAFAAWFRAVCLLTCCVLWGSICTCPPVSIRLLVHWMAGCHHSAHGKKNCFYNSLLLHRKEMPVRSLAPGQDIIPVLYRPVKFVFQYAGFCN